MEVFFDLQSTFFFGKYLMAQFDFIFSSTSNERFFLLFAHSFKVYYSVIAVRNKTNITVIVRVPSYCKTMEMMNFIF